jgi:hypothetical protein
MILELHILGCHLIPILELNSLPQMVSPLFSIRNPRLPREKRKETCGNTACKTTRNKLRIIKKEDDLSMGQAFFLGKPSKIRGIENALLCPPRHAFCFQFGNFFRRIAE